MKNIHICAQYEKFTLFQERSRFRWSYAKFWEEVCSVLQRKQQWKTFGDRRRLRIFNTQPHLSAL